MIRSSHVVLASLGFPGLALAQPPSTPVGPPPPWPAAADPVARTRLGVDAAVVAPVGDYADGVDAALGLFGRVEVPISPQLFVTARLGFLYHLLEEPGGAGLDINVMMFPLYGGLRYDLGTTPQRAFVVAEGGINILRVSTSGTGIDESESESNPSFNLGGGFQLGDVQARVTVFVTPGVGDDGGGDGGDGVNLIGLMATVGIDLAAL